MKKSQKKFQKALAKLGNKIVVIDTDIGLRNLDLLLGLENRIVYTIVDVVEKRCKLKQALVKDKANPNLCLLAAAQTRDKSALNAEQLLEICADLKRDFDYILIDCPAGIEQGFQNAVAGASEAIIVPPTSCLQRDVRFAPLRGGTGPPPWISCVPRTDICRGVPICFWNI